ncbi:MAG: hypothetical protein RL701_4708, partial [Pseudomonadota bacterium]
VVPRVEALNAYAAGPTMRRRSEAPGYVRAAAPCRRL